MIVCGIWLIRLVIEMILEPLTPAASLDQKRNPFVILFSTFIVILAIGAFIKLYGKPGQRLTGSQDQGINLCAASNLTYSGGYFIHSPVISTLTEPASPYFISNKPSQAQKGSSNKTYPQYHTGFFLSSTHPGTLTSQFPIGQAALMASASSIHGLTSMLWVNPVIMIASSLLAGLIASRWFGKGEGILVFLAFLFFPLNVWIAKCAYAEPALLALWLLIILTWGQNEKYVTGKGLLIGLSSGAALLVKIDGIVLILAPLFYILITFRTNKTAALTTLISSSAVYLLAFLWILRFNPNYTKDSFAAQFTLVQQYPWLLVILMAAIGGMLWAILKKPSTLPSASLTKYLPFGGFILLMIVFGYLYFIFPQSTPVDLYYYWPLDKQIRSFREESFFRLGWYFRPVGLLFASIGIGLLLWRLKEPWQKLFVTIGLLALLYFSNDIRNYPIQPYAMRRFIPFAIPLMLMGLAGLSFQISHLKKSFAPYIAGVISLGFLLLFYPLNQRINSHTDHDGLIQTLESIRNHLPADSLVIVSGKGFVNGLASPLEFIYQRCAVILDAQSPASIDPAILQEQISLWHQKGLKVFILSDPSTGKGALKDFPVELVFRENNSMRILSQSMKQPPQGYTKIETPYLLEKLKDASIQ